MKEKNITEIVPSKKYRIDIERGRRHDGTRNRITETVNGNLKQAIERRDELLYEIKHSKLKPDSNMTVLEFTKLWLKDYAEVNVKPSTLQGYKSCLNTHILPRFKDYKLSEITVYELEKFYNDLRKTRSKNTNSTGGHDILSDSVVRHQHSLLCIMLNSAVKWNFIEYNPCLKLTKPPVVKKKEMQFYNEEELQKLFKCLEYEDLTFKAAIYVLVLGGVRRGEALGLCWDLVDFNKKTITIRNNLLAVRGKGVYIDTPKTTKSNRTISLPDSCFELLQELKQKQEGMMELYNDRWKTTDFVFKDEVGNYYNPNRLTRQWKVFTKKHKLKNIRLHDLRHTCATYLLSHNTPVATVSRRLGHSTIYTTFDTYTHSISKDDVEASQLLNTVVVASASDKVSSK